MKTKPDTRDEELAMWHLHLNQYGDKPELVAAFIRELQLDIQCLKDKEPIDRYRRLFNEHDRKRMAEQPDIRAIMDQNEILQRALDQHPQKMAWLKMDEEHVAYRKGELDKREAKLDAREKAMNAKTGILRPLVFAAAKRLGLL